MAIDFPSTSMNTFYEIKTSNDSTSSSSKDNIKQLSSLQYLDLSKRVGESVVACLRNGQDLMGEIIKSDDAYWLRPDTVDSDGGYFPRHFKNNGARIHLGDANGMITADAIKRIHTLVSLSYNPYNKEFHSDVLWSCGDYQAAGVYDADGNWLSDSELVKRARSWNHKTDGKKERILKSTVDPEAELLKVKADIRKREHERNKRKLEKKMARRAAMEAID